jgi:hypothetical protein
MLLTAALAAICRPRKTLVPGRVQGVVCNVVTVLTANIANHYYSVLVSNLEVAIEVEGFDCVTMDTILAGEYSQTREDRLVASLIFCGAYGNLEYAAPTPSWLRGRSRSDQLHG